MENPQPSHQENPPTQYPTGRGYGNDYMRGGEVFGGYGYSEREEYRGPGGAGDEIDDESPPDAAGRQRAEPRGAHGRRHHTADGATTSAGESGAPVPQLEHTFGLHRQGGHSRSFYVTQAQLQQRIYRPQRDEENDEEENPSPS